MKLIALYDFDAKEKNELPLQKNQIVTLVEDQGDWLTVTNKSGQQGLVPVVYVAGPVEEDTKILCRGKLKKAHEASSDGELSLDKDSQVAILAKDDNYWWYVGSSGKTGYIPKHIIKVLRKKTTVLEPRFKVAAIAPEKAMCDVNTTVLFSFEEALPTDGQFMTIFKGDSCEKSVNSIRLNDYTVQVITPKYYPAECVKVHITHQEPGGGPPETISQGLTFEFESKMDLIHEILKQESDPMSFLCSSFKVEHGDVQNVDRILSGMIEKRIPENIEVFKSDCNSVPDETHSKEIPTLLHFAAFYDLKRLTKTLLECPGASKALQQRNCDRRTPSEVAQFRNNNDLELILENHQTDGTDGADDFYETMEQIYNRYTKMDDVSYVEPNSVRHLSDDELYEDMEGTQPESNEEHYVQPRSTEDTFEDTDTIEKVQNDFDVKRGRMSEKEVQVALLVKRVKERYITHEQAMEMARVLRLEPEVTSATKAKTKPKLYKKTSAPVMSELKKKVNSIPRTCSTSSGSSMSSMSSTGSAGSSSGQMERPSGRSFPPLPPVPTSPKRPGSRGPPPVKSKPGPPVPAPRRPPR